MNLDKLLWEGKILPVTYNYLKKKEIQGDEGILTPEEFTNLIIKELLGEDWYVVDPVNSVQIYYCAFEDIIKGYRKTKRKRYCRKYWNKYFEISLYLRTGWTKENLVTTEEEILYIAHHVALISLIKNKKERTERLMNFMLHDNTFGNLLKNNDNKLELSNFGV